jgi:hypothetical protein
MCKMHITWFLQLMSIQVKVVIYINIVNIAEFVTCFDNELIFLYGFRYKLSNMVRFLSCSCCPTCCLDFVMNM